MRGLRSTKKTHIIGVMSHHLKNHTPDNLKNIVMYCRKQAMAFIKYDTHSQKHKNAIVAVFSMCDEMNIGNIFPTIFYLYICEAIANII
jgi:hypothetical protein